MFLLALTASLLLASGLFARAVAAVGNKAAVRAAAQVLRPDTGMPEGSNTNHPVSLREARLANDASRPSATAGVCPASESDDLDHTNTPGDASLCSTTHRDADTPVFPPSASPAPSRGLALGVSHDWAGQPRLTLPRGKEASGSDLFSCTASPRPRVKRGDAERRSRSTTTPALL